MPIWNCGDQKMYLYFKELTNHGKNLKQLLFLNTGGPRLSGPQLPRFRNTGIEKKVPSPLLSGIPRNSGIPISNRYPGILKNS